MLSLLLTLLLLWLFFKLGIGLIKVIGFLLVVGIMFFFFCLFAHSVLGHCASWKLALGNIKIAKNKGPQIAILFTFVSNFQRLVFLKSHSHDHQNEVHRFFTP